MPKATQTHTMTRRQLLASFLGARTAPVIAPLLAAPPNPDAGLLDACAAYVILDAERRETYEAQGGADERALEAATEVMWDELHRLRDLIVGTQARTMEGALARARTYASRYYDSAARGYPTGDDEWLAVVLTDFRTYAITAH